MSDLDFKITTSAELSGAKSVEADLERQIGKAKMLGKDYAELEQKLLRVRAAISGFDNSASWTEKLSASFHKISDQIPGFTRVKNIVTELASGPMGVVAAGFTAMGAGISAAVAGLHEFAQAEEVVAKLDAALARNGQLTKENREAYQALADTLQDETTISGEAWLSVMTRLTQQGVKPDEIEKYTTAVKNLAAIMGGDIETSAMMLTRALNGNLDMLRRYGIVVDETVPEVEKLDRVFQQLAQKGGGQLEASGRSISGQFRALGNDMGDLSKGLGNVISQTGLVQGATELFRDVIGGLKDNLDGLIPQLPGLANGSADAAKAMGDARREAEGFSKYLESIATNANQAVAAMQKLIQTHSELAESENKELDRKKRLELAQFRAGASGRSEKANAMGEAAIENKYESQKSGNTVAAIEKQMAMVKEQMERMLEEERDLQIKIDEARAKAKTKQGSEDLIAEKNRIVNGGDDEPALAQQQKDLAKVVANILTFNEEAGGERNKKTNAEIEKAVQQGVGAVVKLFEDFAKTGRAGALLGLTDTVIQEGSKIVTKNKRLDQIGDVQSQQKAIGDATAERDKLQAANAALYAQATDLFQRLTEQLKNAKADEGNRKDLSAVELQKKMQEALKSETQAKIDRMIQTIENQMYEGMPNEDYRDSKGKGMRGRINLMRDKAELEKRKLGIEQQTGAKSGEEVALLEERKRAIEKALQEAIQKILLEQPFHTPGRPGMVPSTQGPAATDIPRAPNLGSANASVDSLSDTATAIAAVAKRLNDGVAPMETAVELLVDHNDRLAAIEEALRNIRPA